MATPIFFLFRTKQERNAFFLFSLFFVWFLAGRSTRFQQKSAAEHLQKMIVYTHPPNSHTHTHTRRHYTTVVYFLIHFHGSQPSQLLLLLLVYISRTERTSPEGESAST
jgi:hypothetical protein